MLACECNIGLARLTPLKQMLPRSHDVPLPADCGRVKYDLESGLTQAITQIEIFVAKSASKRKVGVESTHLGKDPLS